MRRAGLLGALLLVALLSSVRSAPVATSAAPDLSGWWNALNTGLLGLTPAPPPTVPPGGLYVAGNPFAALPDIPLPRAPDNPLSQLADPTGGQQAISAVRWVLRPGQRAGALRLRVAGAAPAPPTTAIVACPLTFGAFPAGPNQPWAQRPAYDCTKAEVPGRLADDGRTLTFALADVTPVDDVVAVALLPAGAADQVAFEAPGADALEIIGDGDAPASIPDVAVVEDTAPDAVPPLPPPVPLTLPPTPPAGPAPVGAPAPPTTVRDVAAPAADDRDDDGSVVGVAVALAFLAAFAHVTRTDPGARAADGTRGIGRFARPRAGPPPPI